MEMLATLCLVVRMVVGEMVDIHLISFHLDVVNLGGFIASARWTE